MSSLNPSSALKFFVSSLPHLFPDNDCWELLLSLLPETSSEATPLPANPLFDEDPVNDYAEELVLLQYVVQEMRALLLRLGQSGSLTLEHFKVLARHLPAPTGDTSGCVWGDVDVDCAVECVWGDVGTVLKSRKMKVLSPLLAMISEGCETCALVKPVIT